MTYQNDNEWEPDKMASGRGVVIGVLIGTAAYTAIFGVPLFLLWWNS